MVFALGIEYFLSTSPNRPFGHTQQGHFTGWVGLGMILLACGYPLKRWLHPQSGLVQDLVPNSSRPRGCRATSHLCPFRGPLARLGPSARAHHDELGRS